MHCAIGWWSTVRLAGKEPDVEAVVRIFRVDWHAQLAAGEYDLDGKTPEEYRDLGEALVRLFVERFKTEPPMASEQRFEVPLRQPEDSAALPIPLVGFFDLVGDGLLGEIKTAARKTSVDSYSRFHGRGYGRSRHSGRPGPWDARRRAPRLPARQGSPLQARHQARLRQL